MCIRDRVCLGSPAWTVDQTGDDFFSYDIRHPDSNFPTISRKSSIDEFLGNGSWHAVVSHGEYVWPIKPKTGGYEGLCYKAASGGGLSRHSSGDFSVTQSNVSIKGAVTAGDLFWVVYAERKMHAFLPDRHDNYKPKRHSASDYTISGSDNFNGGFSYGDRVWLGNRTDDELRGFLLENGTLSREDDHDVDTSDITTHDIQGGFRFDDRIWMLVSGARKLYSLDALEENNVVRNANDKDDHTTEGASVSYQSACQSGSHAYILDDTYNALRGYSKD